MVFAVVRTHFPKKNTSVYRNKHSNALNSRNIKSSRNTSLEFAAFDGGSDKKHGRGSASTDVNPAAINKQLFNY